MLPLAGRHGGRIIDTAGDGIMAEFSSVIGGATECAVGIQTVMAERNDGVPEHRRMRFRIGINLGDVIHDETRIYGDGIRRPGHAATVASRLRAVDRPPECRGPRSLGAHLAPRPEDGPVRPATVRAPAGGGLDGNRSSTSRRPSGPRTTPARRRRNAQERDELGYACPW